MRRLAKRIGRGLARWRERSVREGARRRSLEVALKRFSKLHPHWYGSCFDRFFIERIPSDSLALMEPRDLALEWTRQFRYRDERLRSADIRQLTPVAESFLTLFREAQEELEAKRSAERPGATSTEGRAKPDVKDGSGTTSRCPEAAELS